MSFKSQFFRREGAVLLVPDLLVDETNVIRDFATEIQVIYKYDTIDQRAIPVQKVKSLTDGGEIVVTATKRWREV